MPEQVAVRRALETDAGAITQFNIDMALETENKQLNRKKIEAGVHSLFRHPEFGFYVVAEFEQRIVGCLMITYEWSDWRNGLFWWIQSVYVAPNYRRLGVYKTMYNTIREMAADYPQVCGFRLYVERDNEVAQSVYHKLGMDETPYKLFEEEL